METFNQNVSVHISESFWSLVCLAFVFCVGFGYSNSAEKCAIFTKFYFLQQQKFREITRNSGIQSITRYLKLFWSTRSQLRECWIILIKSQRFDWFIDPFLLIIVTYIMLWEIYIFSKVWFWRDLFVFSFFI